MKQVCRICLKVINDLNFVALKTDEPSQIKKQLLFCVPEMVVDLVKDPVFCKSCVSALHSSYSFKNLCLSTEEHIKYLKISHSKSINIKDSLYDLLQSTNGVSGDNGECKNTREAFLVTPNTNILLSDEDLANGQNLNTETQRSVTVPIDSFNKTNNVALNGFSKLSKHTSVDELDSLSDDALWNTSVQPLSYEEEVKNEYKDITIDENFSLPKMEPSWSYEGYENILFEDAKSGDCTTDNENNRASVQTNTVIQDCFVKPTRLPSNISYNNVNKSNYKGNCNFRSAQKSHSKQHLRILTSEKPFTCNVCTFCSTQKSHLQQHLRIHTGERSFGCNLCSFRSAHKSSIKRHLQMHTGEKPFACTVCGYRSAAQSDLRKHGRIHTGEKLFTCTVCYYRCAQKSHLKEHLKIHTGEKPYACDLCTFRFTSNSNLQRHLRTHTGEKPFTCTVCYYRCAQKSHLKEHLKIHTGEKPYACDLCTFRFTNNSNLQRHLRTHTGEKPFACNVCDYRSAGQSDLRRHLKIHTGEKPFACNVCDYRSLGQSDLQKHLRIHSGEKPFACNVCDYRSARQSSLRLHLSIHTGEKTYSCDVCTFRSKQKSNLQRHLRIHTGDKT